MFTKLNEVLKKSYKGIKFMDVNASERNDEKFQGLSQAGLREIMENLGATSAILHLENDESALTVYQVNGLGVPLNAYEALQRRIKRSLDADTLRALGAIAPSPDSGEGVDKQTIANALHHILDEVPEKYRKQIYEKMGKAIGENIPSTKSSKKKDDTDEDEMLSELL